MVGASLIENDKPPSQLSQTYEEARLTTMRWSRFDASACARRFQTLVESDAIDSRTRVR